MHLPLVDGIRGYLIFAMTVGHFIAITQVGALNFLTHKPFAVFLTGEGFMAVSGFMSGYVLTLGLPRRGVGGSLVWGLRRSAKIVAHYIVVFALCALPALIWPLEGSFASTLFHGRSGFSATDIGLLLSGLYRPGFFDVLYLYVVYIAIAPVFLLLFLSRLRYGALGLSLLLWLFTQYGFTQRGFEKLFGLIPVARIEEAGSFHVFAWQLLFFAGLSLGALFARDRYAVLQTIQNIAASALKPGLAGLLIFAVVGLLSSSGIAPLGLRYLQDYLIAAPLPLMNFTLACLVLAIFLSSPDWSDRAVVKLLRGLFHLAPLRTIGKVTLQSFSASIVLSYWVAYSVPVGTATSPAFAFAALSLCMIGVWIVSKTVLWRRAVKRDGGRGDVPKERAPSPSNP